MDKQEISEAFQEISRVQLATAPASKVKVQERKGTIGLGGLSFALSPYTVGKVNEALPVPGDYFTKLPSDRMDLVVPHTRFQLDQMGDAELTAIAGPDGTLMAVRRATQTPPSNPIDVINILDDLAEIVEWQVITRGADAWRFFAITEQSREIRVGDITKAGYDISGSVAGYWCLHVARVSYRLVCSNGMTHASHGGQFRRNHGGGDGLDDWMADAVGAIQSGNEHVFDQLEETAAVPMDDARVTNVMDTLRSLRFPQVRAVRRRFRDDPPETLYDVIQHVSAVATHMDTGQTTWGTFSRRRRMQLLAGALVGQLTSCNECHQLAHVMDADDADAVQEQAAAESSEPAQVIDLGDGRAVEVGGGWDDPPESSIAPQAAADAPSAPSGGRRGRRRSYFQQMDDGRFWCNACMAAFDADGRPDTCPDGHAADPII